MVYVYLGFWDKFPETKLFNHRLSTSSILVDMDKSPPPMLITMSHSVEQSMRIAFPLQPYQQSVIRFSHLCLYDK